MSSYGLSIISIIMPILLAVIIFIVVVLLILVYYKTRKQQSLNIQAFQKLAQELKSDHYMLKSELDTMKGTLDSIHKMMKEIE